MGQDESKGCKNISRLFRMAIYFGDILVYTKGHLIVVILTY